MQALHTHCLLMEAAAIPLTIFSLNTAGTIAVEAVCAAHRGAVMSQTVSVIVGVARLLWRLRLPPRPWRWWRQRRPPPVTTGGGALGAGAALHLHTSRN